MKLLVKFIPFIFCVLAFPVLKAQLVQDTFPLDDVKLLNSPFLTAEQTNTDYMLKLKPDRLLAPFLREAGLQPKAQSYGNWESSGLDGHIGGHYLTALAQMQASSGNPEWKRRLDYMVSELKRCQDKNGNGYVGGIPGGAEMWTQLKTGDFTLYRKKWVAWYNIHKLYAGLRDAYLLGKNIEAKDVLIKLCDWAEKEVEDLTEKQMQQMLSKEHGGMNEIFADVAAITGKSKYLTLAKKFCHQSILLPLEAHEDKLDGIHANTQIPKIIGFERIAELTNEKKYDEAARFFWETVVKNRSVSIGGNSVREHFNPATDFTSMLESEQGPESCNSYNMLKLTKQLFLSKANAKYMDYYERTLYNHILSTQRKGGGFVYFTPIRPQHYRVYSQPQEGFWCCVGTGIENHGKYGELIYSRQADDLYVNLFIASILEWRDKGITITQNNNFPFEEHSELKVNLRTPKKFKIFIRKPGWVTSNAFQILVNGKQVDLVQDSASLYVSINREWCNNDKVSISLPMTNHLEYLPDHSPWASIVHGPIVLAAATDSSKMAGLFADDSRSGHIARGPLYPLSSAPLLIDKGNSISDALKSVAGKPLNYKLEGVIYQPQYQNLTLRPFYEIQDNRYILYWPIAKKNFEDQFLQNLAQNDRLLMTASERTIDQVSPGEQQPESDHEMQNEESIVGVWKDRHWRSATGYISYKMKMSTQTKILQVTYYGANRGRDFDIFINDYKVGHTSFDGSRGERFLTVDYNIPLNMRKDQSVIIKFAATKGAATAELYDVRLIK